MNRALRTMQSHANVRNGAATGAALMAGMGRKQTKGWRSVYHRESTQSRHSTAELNARFRAIVEEGV